MNTLNNYSYGDNLDNNDNNLYGNTIGSPIEYQETGNAIPMDKMMIILYMYILLADYDKSIENKENPAINPYVDRVVMDVGEGKLISIPVDIQKYAIQKWILARENTSQENKKSTQQSVKTEQVASKINSESNAENQQKIEEEDDGIIVHTEGCFCKSCDYKKSTIFWHILKILIIALIIAAIVYFFMKNNSENEPPLDYNFMAPQNNAQLKNIYHFSR